MSEKGGKVQRRSAGDSILGSMVNSSFSISWTTSEIYIIEVSRMLLMSSHNVHALEVNGTQARMAFQKHRPSNTSRRTCSKWLLSVWIWLPTRLLSELIHLWLVKLLASVGQNLTPLRTCPWRDNHSKAVNLTNSWPPLHRWGLGTLHVGARFVKSALWIALPPSKKKTHITWCKKTIQNCYSTVLPLDISMHKTSQQGSFFTVSKACSRLPSFERLEIMIGQAQFGIMWWSQKLLFLCVCVCVCLLEIRARRW